LSYTRFAVAGYNIAPAPGKSPSIIGQDRLQSLSALLMMFEDDNVRASREHRARLGIGRCLEDLTSYRHLAADRRVPI